VKSNFAFYSLCSTCWGEQPSYRVLVGKPDGKRPLGGSLLRWEDIKLGIKQIKYDKIHLAEDRYQWQAF
jgi:hypothetical protein